MTRSASYKFTWRLQCRSRRVIILLMTVISWVGIYADPTQAKPQNPNGNDCWIDSASGKSVRLLPAGLGHNESQSEAVHSGHAHLVTGQNVSQNSSGTWIDSASGLPVNTLPAGLGHSESQSDAVHSGHAHLVTGQNVVRVPCPPPHHAAVPRHAAPNHAAVPTLPFSFSIGIGGFGHQDKEK